MDRLGEFLGAVEEHDASKGEFLGLLHVLIGRRISRSDGTLVSNGIIWREAAALLKKARWDKEAVRELGLDPAKLPPRDRQRFWYTAIAQAGVDSCAAVQSADRLAKRLADFGYHVSPASSGERPA